MGHRALVAYERADARFDVHYSHWGAAGLRLARSIDPETPFGDGIAGASVDAEPIAEGVDLETIVARHVDFLLHEALFVVERSFAVTAFRACWFGVYTAEGVVEGDAAAGRGALIEVSADDPRDDGYVTGWYRGIREGAGELIDRGVLDEADLVPYLVDHLERFAAGDRQLVLDPVPSQD